MGFATAIYVKYASSSPPPGRDVGTLQCQCRSAGTKFELKKDVIRVARFGKAKGFEVRTQSIHLFLPNDARCGEFWLEGEDAGFMRQCMHMYWDGLLSWCKGCFQNMKAFFRQLSSPTQYRIRIATGEFFYIENYQILRSRINIAVNGLFLVRNLHQEWASKGASIKYSKALLLICILSGPKIER